MNLDSEVKRAIADSLAAIDLVSELLGEQRRILEKMLQDEKQPNEAGVTTVSALRYHGYHGKGPPTTLSIEINGRSIAESQAATGLVKAIEFIGPDRVRGMGFKLGGRELVVSGVKPHGRGYHRCGDHWIATHSSTAEKRSLLESVCRRLALKASIQQVPRYAPSVI